MSLRRLIAGSIGVITLAALAGCSGGSGNLATVSGTVTHNGAPVNGAQVTLHSTVAAAGQQAASYSATTDSNGKYVIAMVGKEPGIPPGMYKVTIVKLNLSGNLPEDFDQGQVEASGVGRNVLPEDYERVTTTQLSVTLEAGKNENKNFDLKGKATSATDFGTP